MAELAGKAFVEVFAADAGRFAGVGASFQKVGRGDRAPRRSNRVRFDAARALRVISVTRPDAVHLKDLDHWDGRVIQEVVEAQVGGIRLPEAVLCDGPLVGHIATADGLLRNTEITEETSSEGGWHAFQELGNCWGA